MEKLWKQKVSKFDILKNLIKYKKLWYNHVTFLWWEPFIQWVFFDALNIAKKLWYTILVTTNATTLHINSQAKKFLPLIDELILSVQAIEKGPQQIISRTKNYVIWKEVFENIKKYFLWKTLKSNIVVTQDNLEYLYEIVRFLNENNIREISITYPDIAYTYYEEKFILDRIAPKYSDCLFQILRIIEFSNKNKIKLKIVDFPLCVFKNYDINKIIEYSDDFDYWTRTKLFFNKNEYLHSSKEINDSSNKFNENLFHKVFYEIKYFFNKNKLYQLYKNIPRKRSHINKCRKCSYKNICWGPSIYYNKLYWFKEIIPIKPWKMFK